MWLINTTTLRLEHTLREGVHEYAILSHTWGDGEVSHEEYMKAPAAASQKAGSKKINFICEQARKDNLDYAWVDTCCINKDSSSELSEVSNASSPGNPTNVRIVITGNQFDVPLVQQRKGLLCLHG